MAYSRKLETDRIDELRAAMEAQRREEEELERKLLEEEIYYQRVNIGDESAEIKTEKKEEDIKEEKAESPVANMFLDNDEEMLTDFLKQLEERPQEEKDLIIELFLVEMDYIAQRQQTMQKEINKGINVTSVQKLPPPIEKGSSTGSTSSGSSTGFFGTLKKKLLKAAPSLDNLKKESGATTEDRDGVRSLIRRFSMRLKKADSMRREASSKAKGTPLESLLDEVPQQGGALPSKGAKGKSSSRGASTARGREGLRSAATAQQQESEAAPAGRGRASSRLARTRARRANPRSSSATLRGARSTGVPPSGTTAQPGVGEETMKRGHGPDSEEDAAPPKKAAAPSPFKVKPLKDIFPMYQHQELNIIQKARQTFFIQRLSTDAEYLKLEAAKIDCDPDIFRLQDQDKAMAINMLSQLMVLGEEEDRLRQKELLKEKMQHEDNQSLVSEVSMTTVGSTGFPSNYMIKEVDHLGQKVAVPYKEYKTLVSAVKTCKTNPNRTLEQWLADPTWLNRYPEVPPFLSAMGLENLLQVKLFLTQCTSRVLQVQARGGPTQSQPPSQIRQPSFTIPETAKQEEMKQPQPQLLSGQESPECLIEDIGPDEEADRRRYSSSDEASGEFFESSQPEKQPLNLNATAKTSSKSETVYLDITVPVVEHIESGSLPGITIPRADDDDALVHESAQTEEAKCSEPMQLGSDREESPQSDSSYVPGSEREEDSEVSGSFSEESGSSKGAVVVGDIATVSAWRTTMENVAAVMGDMKQIPDFDKHSELTDEQCQYIVEHLDDFHMNHVGQRILPCEEGAMYLYELPKGMEKDIHHLGELDPFIWRSDKTRKLGDGKKHQKLFKLKTTLYAGKSSTKEDARRNFIPGLSRIIYTLPDNHYVIQYRGKVSSARIDPRKGMFKNAAEEHAAKLATKKQSQREIDSEQEQSDANEEEELHRVLRAKKGNSTEFFSARPLLENAHVRLSPKEIDRYLNSNISPDLAVSLPRRDYITEPAAGLVYLYDVSDLRCDWKGVVLADTLRFWKRKDNRKGSYTYGHDTYYLQSGVDRDTDSAFQKHVYYNTQHHRVMIHYMGNDNLRVWRSHGNAKQTDIPFIRRADVVQKKIWGHSLSTAPGKILHDARAKMPAGCLGSLTTPMNINQINYERGKMRKNMRWGEDDANTVCEVFDDNSDMMRKVIMKPDLGVVCITDESIQHATRIFRNHTINPEDPPLMFEYDTTFEFGPYYLSVLSIKDPLFLRNNYDADPEKFYEGSPQVPLGVFIHERKLQENHKDFFRQIIKYIDDASGGGFTESRKLLVVDQEFGEQTWAQTGPVVYCWRHLKTNCRNKLSKEPDELVKAVMHQIDAMLRSTSFETFQRRLDAAADDERTGHLWSGEFGRYFTRTVAPKITEHSGRWLLDQLHVEDAHDGLTTNEAEGLNRKLMDLKKSLKEIGLSEKVTFQEAAVVTRAFLDSSDMRCTLAMHGQGDYHLRPKYAKLQRPVNETPAMNKRTMEEVMQSIRDRLGGRKFAVPGAEEESEEDVPVGTYVPDAPAMAEEPEQASIPMLAKFYCDNDRVVYVKDFNNYLVKESSGETRIVSLSKPSCSCLGKGFCAHFLAASYAAGVIDNFDMAGVKRRGKAPEHPNFLRGHESKSSKRPKRRDHVDAAAPKVDETAKPGQQTFSAPTDPTMFGKTGNTTDFDYGIHHETQPGKAFPHVPAKMKPMTTSTPMGKQSGKGFPIKATIQSQINMQHWIKQQAIQKNMRELEVAQRLHLIGKHAETLVRRFRTKEFKNNFSTQLSITVPNKLIRIGDNRYAFSREDANRVIAIRPPDGHRLQDDKDIMQFAARTIRHHLTRSDQIYVRLGSVDNNNFIEAFSDFSKGSTKLVGMVKEETFNIICYCNDPIPTTSKSSEETFTCHGCNNQYHNSCTTQCGLCGIGSFDGAAWGAGGFSNTCTIDNELTSLALNCQNDGKFEDMVVSYPYHDERINAYMMQTIAAAKRKDWGAVHRHWADIRQVNAELQNETIAVPNDFHGNPARMFTNQILEAGSLTYHITCESCNSPREHTISTFASAECRKAIDSQIVALIGNPSLHSHVPNCSNASCGDARFYVDRIEANESWFLHFDLENSAYTAQEVMNLPKELEVGSSKYGLRLVTFNSGGDHFRGFLMHQGTFLSYDGLRQGKKIALPVPGDFEFNFERMSITGVTYHRIV